MKSKLIKIAKFLMTEQEGKNHGSYLVYKEEGKIKIMYDTYYPNVNVYVWTEGKRALAALFSGHGHTQEYHPGAWEKYVSDELYPKALEAEEKYNERMEQRKQQQRSVKFGALNDKATFV